ncbi:MAG: prepilin-type N-terminal cleavage/methylation domain-containing protein, partial [Acidobacteriota bacterium]
MHDRLNREARGRCGYGERGLTLLEVLVVIGILVVLAGAALPVAKIGIKRQKELELRRNLRDMRRAIDEYKKIPKGMMIERDVEAEGYPPDLEALVEGVELMGGSKMKFMRRIPVDPMTGEAEWGLRSYQDDHDSRSWGRQNVYDV